MANPVDNRTMVPERLPAAGAGSVNRYMVVETLVSTAINVVLAGLVTTLMFANSQLVLWGAGGLARDFVPATFLPVLMMTAGLTWVTRRRRREGKAPTHAAGPLALPRHPLLRGAAFAAVATLLLGGLGLAVLIAAWSPAPPFGAVLCFKLAFASALGLVVTPLILIAAMRDRLDAA